MHRGKILKKPRYTYFAALIKDLGIWFIIFSHCENDAQKCSNENLGIHGLKEVSLSGKAKRQTLSVFRFQATQKELIFVLFFCMAV